MDYSRQGYARPSIEEEFSDAQGEYTRKAGEMASHYGEKVQEQLETGKDQAAGRMERAAGQPRQRAVRTGGMQAEAGTKVADTMDQTAAYLREHSTGEIWQDLEMYVREHPGRALVGAAIAGFMLGRILR